jgi:hypothetical protein
MDITPHVNLLKSLRADRVNYIQLIGEGVDNAFDAGATSIFVTIDQDHVEFVDNGLGITRDRISALFSLGKHGAQTTTALGRFGVGITSQAVNAGDKFEVDSTSVNGSFYASANWRTVLKSGLWAVDEPRWKPVAIGTATGTTVKISILRKAPTVTLEKITSDLALVFHPALASGQVIKLNGQPIPTLEEPRMTDIIDRHLTLSDGRGAHVRAGILVEPSSLNMVHVGYQHRVIMPRSRLGCGLHSGLTKMFARVQISGKAWHLAKFKDDLTDENEREELEEAVAAALLPILEKCSSASMTARIKAITSQVNELIPPELKPSRPIRAKGGSSSNGGGGRKRSGMVDEGKSDERETGPARSKRKPKDQLIINLDGTNYEQGVGSFIPGRPHCVNLSPDNPHVARLIALRDQDIAVESLYALALSVFIAARKDELPLFSFGQQLAQLLSLQGAVAIRKKA